MNRELTHQAYRDAIAADDAYSAECKRVYGSNAGLRRYLAHTTGDAKLIAAMHAKMAADATYFAYCRANDSDAGVRLGSVPFGQGEGDN